MKLVNIHIPAVLLFLLFVFFPYSRGRAQTLTLEQCVDTALVFNRALQAGRNDQALSRLKQREARANLLPKVTAEADYRYFTHLPTQLLPLEVFNGPEGRYRDAQFGVPHNIGANVQLAMPLYNPQIKGGIQAAVIAGELSDLQYRKSEEQAIFEVTNLYYNAQILHHQLTFIDSNLANVSRLLGNMELLREQGLAKGTDVGKLQLQGEQLSAQKLQTESKLEQVLNGLKFLMGVSLDRPLSVQPEIEQREAAKYSVSPSLDLQILQARNRLLANELNTLQKSRLPSVSLLANYGLAGFGYGRQPEPFLKFFPVGFVGVRAAFPIWDGTTRLQIEQKRMELRNNVIQSDQVQAQTGLLIANALLQRATAERTIQTSSQQIELAQTVYRQTVLQQEQGTATLADVLLADNDLRQAQQQYLNAIIEYLKAELGLKSARVQRATIQEQINKTTVKAPFGGVIVAKLNEEGGFAAPGVPLLHLMDIAQLKFTIHVSESDLKHFQPGRDYTVTADAFPDRPLPGKVSMVGSKANAGNSFPVQFTVRNFQNYALKAGMFGKVSVAAQN